MITIRKFSIPVAAAIMALTAVPAVAMAATSPGHDTMKVPAVSRAQATANPNAVAPDLANGPICDDGTANLCLSDPKAVKSFGTALDMAHSEPGAPSQEIQVHNSDTYGCAGDVVTYNPASSQGCPFTNLNLDNILKGDQIVALNFDKLGSSLCVGADTSASHHAILSTCTRKSAVWVVAPGQVRSGYSEILNVYLSNSQNKPGGEVLTGAGKELDDAFENPWVQGLDQIWN